MAEYVRMPEVLAGVTEAAIQGWLVSVGDQVDAGTPIAEIETEKAMVEFNAEAVGTVAALIAEPGQTVAVGEPILVLSAEGDSEADIKALLNEALVVPDAAVAPDAASASEPDTGQSQPSPIDAPMPAAVAEAVGDGTRIFASPIVRRLAREHGIELAALVGTGENGRIVRPDIEKYLEQPSTGSSAEEELAAPPSVASTPAPAPDGATTVPLTGMRKAIARRLTESKSSVPHFYLTAHCTVDKLLELRAQVNEASTQRISVNDFVVKAAAQALMEVPNSNMIWGGDHLIQFDQADISIAVATDGGLLTPIVRGANLLSVGALGAAIADLATRAREGRLQQKELEGGSLAVSNLGMYGVDEFSAILNPPQSGILAVGAASDQAVVVEGEIVIRKVMTVTISWDHRVVDGAVGAEWLAAFKRRIENPLTLMV